MWKIRLHIGQPKKWCEEEKKEKENQIPPTQKKKTT